MNEPAIELAAQYEKVGIHLAKFLNLCFLHQMLDGHPASVSLQSRPTRRKYFPVACPVHTLHKYSRYCQSLEKTSYWILRRELTRLGENSDGIRARRAFLSGLDVIAAFSAIASPHRQCLPDLTSDLGPSPFTENSEWMNVRQFNNKQRVES